MDGVSVSGSRGLRVYPRRWRVSALPRAELAPHISAQLTRASSARRVRTPIPTSGTSPMPSSGRRRSTKTRLQKDEAVKIMVAKLEEGKEPVGDPGSHHPQPGKPG